MGSAALLPSYELVAGWRRRRVQSSRFHVNSSSSWRPWERRAPARQEVLPAVLAFTEPFGGRDRARPSTSRFALKQSRVLPFGFWRVSAFNSAFLRGPCELRGSTGFSPFFASLRRCVRQVLPFGFWRTSAPLTQFAVAPVNSVVQPVFRFSSWFKHLDPGSRTARPG